MDSAYDVILSRRSIKKYKPEQITDEELDRILTAGTFAPTAKNLQSPVMVSVQNSDDIAALEKLNCTSVGREFSHTFYGAPTVIAVFAQRGNPNGVQDASLVMANLMHAANAIGLGSCWINRAKESFAADEGKALMAKWGLDPEKWDGVAICTVGYADHAPAASPRKDGYIIKIK